MIFLKLFSDLINRIEERSGNKLELPSTLMLVDIHAALDKPNNCKILSQSKSKSKSKVQSPNSKVKRTRSDSIDRSNFLLGGKGNS